jgi:membrane associated rhomboid family serine protease
MLIPIGDDDRKLSGPAFITITLLLLNVGIFVLQTQDPEMTYRLAVVPHQISQGENLSNEVPLDHRPTTPQEIPQREGPTPIQLTLLTSLFLHGGWLHLLSNMLYLWIFGDNVEHRFGHGIFLLFYLVSGVAGSIVQIALEPGSLIPMLGASGAVSGILGAYLVLFPRNRVHAIFFFFIVSIPAILAIGFWIVLQVVAAVDVLAAGPTGEGGVAYAAHVGGFAAGVLAGLFVRITRGAEKPSRLSRAMASDPDDRRLW